MNSRYLASLSLAFMAAGFIVTLFLPESTWVMLLQGGFEAGLVGGIADWFAVTALFRHPLGLPIPHTSLLLRNRDKIVQSLISAMENELLNKKSIESKLRKLNLLAFGSKYITKMVGRKKIRRSILEALRGFILRISLEPLVPIVQAAAADYVRQANVKQASDAILTRVMNEGYDERAFDFILGRASEWAQRTDTKLMLGRIANEKLAEVKMGGLMGFAFQAFAGFMDDDKLGGMLQGMLVSGINGLQDDENTYRDTILREIRVQLFQLTEDEGKLAEMKAWAVRVIEGEDASSFILTQLIQLRSLLLDKLETEQANGGRKLFTLYRYTVRMLEKDTEMLKQWENRLLNYIVQLVEDNHYRISKLVKENLDQMDDAALVSMLEEKIGKDLQWIRVNGALCGFVVGVILALLQL
ncbi:DUF445 domain-containing protein [Paenibacillus sp. GCM10023252]|uniref:DUF445 domain-containing protein n=1 Tax=Paenibacillus sp. GCM10023252 TaxID=3252649 RepID=UPI00360992E0